MTRRLAIALLVVAACAGSCSRVGDDIQAQAPEGGNLVVNPGFEDVDGDSPRGWTFETRASRKGKASVSRLHAHSGQLSLTLEPNERNRPWDIANHPLSMGQALPAGPYRGKTLHLSGWLAAQGQAVAVVGLYALRSDGGVVFARIDQDSSKPGPVYHEDALVVPNDSKVQYIIINAAVEGTQGAAFIDDVVVSLSAAEKTRTESSGPGTFMSADISIDAADEIRRIPRTLYGTNVEWIWNANGIWSPDAKGLDPEIIRLTREAGFSLMRFPGGVFSDFYHWRDGVGPINSRPTTEHSPGGPKSPHVFGTDEALAFAQAAGSELLITVNAGTGTAKEAADWVRYINGRAGSAPRVTYWEIGNELYIKDPRFVSITPAVYLRRLQEFVRAMREVDPSIKIAAISDHNYPRSVTPDYKDWTDQVLRDASSEVDFLAVHNAYAPMLPPDSGADVRSVYAAMLAAPALMQKNLNDLAARIDELPRSRSRRPKIAVTEWGPFFQLDARGRFSDHVKTLGSALFVASTLKVFVETPAVEIANAFKLVDPLFMGWIGLRDGRPAPTAPYLALQLFTRHFGERLVSSTTRTPTYNSTSIGWVERVQDVPYLDVVASRSADGRTLYVIAVNKHLDRPIAGRFTLRGFEPSGSATAWVLNGTAIDANTGTRPIQTPGIRWVPQATAEPGGRFERGGPGEVTLTSSEVANVAATFEYVFPPHSATSLEIREK